MSLTVVEAVAGSGKTYKIISELNTEIKTLIVTYTESNRDQIIERTIIKFGFLPKNIIILTWLEFLFRDLARPYSNQFIKGMVLDGVDIYTKKEDLHDAKGVNQCTSKYYINSKNQIYSFRLSLFCTNLIKKSNLVIDRVGRLYNKVYIDEVQDLTGNDYDIVKNISDKIETKIVGDPLQKTYNTHQTNKYSNYKTIFDFLKGENINFTPVKLDKTRRFGKKICKFINEIFPDLEIESNAKSLDEEFIGFIDHGEVTDFITIHNPIALTYNKNTKTHTKKRINIGKSKGLEYDSVLIYITPDMIKACIDKNCSLLEYKTKCYLYVALTRAKKTVGIYVYDKKQPKSLF